MDRLKSCAMRQEGAGIDTFQRACKLSSYCKEEFWPRGDKTQHTLWHLRSGHPLSRVVSLIATRRLCVQVAIPKRCISLLRTYPLRARCIPYFLEVGFFGPRSNCGISGSVRKIF